MLAMAGDEILMETDAELGPIDPQFTLPRADGTITIAPAQAIIDQFDAVEKKISKNPELPVFRILGDLRKVRGIGPKTLKRLTPYLIMPESTLH